LSCGSTLKESPPGSSEKGAKSVHLEMKPFGDHYPLKITRNNYSFDAAINDKTKDMEKGEEMRQSNVKVQTKYVNEQRKGS